MKNPNEVRDRQSKNVKKGSQADVIFQTVSEMVEDRKVAPEQIDKYIEEQLKAGHDKPLEKAGDKIWERAAKCAQTVNQFSRSVSNDYNLSSCGSKVTKRDAAFLEKLGKDLLSLQFDCRMQSADADDGERMDILRKDVKSILGIYRVELDRLSEADPDLKDWCAERQAKLEQIKVYFDQSCGVPNPIDSKTVKTWLSGMWTVYRALQKRSGISEKFAANKAAVQAAMRNEFWIYDKLCDMADDEKVTASQIYDYLNGRQLSEEADMVDKARDKMEYKRAEYDGFVHRFEDSLRKTSDSTACAQALAKRDQSFLKRMEKNLLLLQIDCCRLAINEKDMEKLKEDMQSMLKIYHSELDHLSAANPSLKAWCDGQRNKLKEIEHYFNNHADPMASVSIMPWFDHMGKVYRDLKACSQITNNFVKDQGAVKSFVEQEFRLKKAGNTKQNKVPVPPNQVNNSMMSQFSSGNHQVVVKKVAKK